MKIHQYLNLLLLLYSFRLKASFSQVPTRNNQMNDSFGDSPVAPSKAGYYLALLVQNQHQNFPELMRYAKDLYFYSGWQTEKVPRGKLGTTPKLFLRVRQDFSFYGKASISPTCSFLSQVPGDESVKPKRKQSKEKIIFISSGCWQSESKAQCFIIKVLEKQE